jgi:Zn-dependent protease with chaperone function
MKRIFLFVLTNIAVVAVLGIVASLLGVNRYLTPNGLNLGMLLGFALVIGFGGAIISLLISKPVAKWSAGVRVINEAQNADEAWIVETVRKLAEKAQIGMPEVGIFEGAPNAFATGAFKNSSLVAVSTGLLQGMTKEEIEAVLGHEIAHIANGDMVTMTLIQGVMNTFVVFLSRVIGYAVDSFLRRGSDTRHRLLRQHHRAGHRARFCRSHRRGLVLAPARVPRRRRRRAADGPAPAHDERPGAPGWHAAGRAAQGRGGHGHHRQHRQAVCHAPAD